MKKIFVMILLTFGIACTDFVGLERDINLTRQQAMVADVQCPDTIAVGEVGSCLAYNTAGTVISVDGAMASFLLGYGWVSAFPDVATVDLTGAVKGLAPGSTIITGNGSDGSFARDTVIVR